MDKNNLRIMCKNKRVSVKNKHDKSLSILENLKKLNIIEKAKVVGLYSSFNGEVATEEIFSYLKKSGVKVVYPKVIRTSVMEFYSIRDLRDLVKGTYGILEPPLKEEKTEPDIIIVPGLAFSEDGDRLGYGGGYYDRYLEGKNVLKIGLCYQDLIANIETDEYDIKMDYVITEEKIYKK